MPEDKGQAGPAPEVLTGKTDKPGAPAAAGGAPGAPGAPGAGGPLAGGKRPKWMKRGGYAPTHKATFIAIGIVTGILAINAGIIAFVVSRQKSQEKAAASASLTLSQDALDKVGINRSSIGSDGVELVVNPNAKFAGKVQVGGDATISGQLKLNNKLTANDAAISKLEAGDAALQALNVNGNGTITTLNLRNDLNVVGTSRFQGEVIISKLTTVNHNMNVAGSVAVGGTLSVNNFQTSRLTIDSTLTIGGHILTKGLAPTMNIVGGLGMNGTASISGNDSAGTITINVGVGGSAGGNMATVTFRTPYSSIPHVIVGGIGQGLGSVYATRSSTGFTVGVNGAFPAGTYAFDYIVVQ